MNVNEAKLDISIRKIAGRNLILPYLVKEGENNCISASINTSESTNFCSSCDLSVKLCTTVVAQTCPYSAFQALGLCSLVLLYPNMNDIVMFHHNLVTLTSTSTCFKKHL